MQRMFRFLVISVSIYRAYVISPHIGFVAYVSSYYATTSREGIYTSDDFNRTWWLDASLDIGEFLCIHAEFE